MMMLKINSIFFFWITIFTVNVNYSQNKQSEMDLFIDNLMNKMTLEEKLGQLNLPSSGDIVTGQAKSSNIAESIKNGQVGGLFNIKGVEKIKEVQKIAVEKSRLKIPLLFGMDVIHGYETTFPIPLGLASSWDLSLIEKSAQIAAKEATADGICWTFSPMVDISRDPRWGRVSEGSGEDSFLGSEIAKAMIRGYQGNDLSSNQTMMSCAKHFALYGAGEAGRDYNTVDMSRQRMYNEYFPPFLASVQAGVGTFMASFNEVDGIPATASKWLMTDVLRNQWKFNGFVVTDYTGISEMIDHGIGDLPHVSQLALKAGIDMDMVSEGFLSTLKKSVEEKKVSIEEINTSVRRILEAKYRLGLFKNPYLYCDGKRKEKEIYSQEHRIIARSIASQSMVLLQNKNQTLPLNLNKKIALIGPLADNVENMAGTWSVATVQSRSISLLQGLKNSLQNSEILHAKGCNLDYDAKFEEKASMFGKNTYRDVRDPKVILDEAVDAARKSDIILLAVGESAEMSGESSSRTQITIPQSQKDLIRAMIPLNKPIVLVLFTGRPLDLSEEVNQVDAIVNVWFAGSEAGDAIADVLFGKINPSGKLPMTFPRNVGQVPIHYNHKNTGRPLSKEKINDCEFEKFKSNYIDQCNTPLFSFGFGLSYTSFVYSNLTLSSESLNSSDTLTATITLSNHGNYDGNEVVQLYIRDKVGSVTRPVKELKGFQKIFLKKGETKRVTFEISTDLLKFYNYDLKYDWEEGEFEIMIGTNSENVQSKTVYWKKN